MLRAWLLRLVLILSSAGLISCGGGLALLLAEGGIGGTGISLGPILAFGSVVVNGVKYETDTAQFVVNGDDMAEQDDLRLGMIVTVVGETNDDNISGTAEAVSYEPNLIGPVTTAPVGDTFRAMKQTVIVDARTQYDNVPGNDVSGLNEGDIVEVSGHVDVNGTIYATFVGASNASQYEITGFVTDRAAGSFAIGDLTVIWDDDKVKRGDYVEVRGLLNNNDELVADDVENRLPGVGVSDSDKVDIEGVVTSDCVGLPCTFTLGAQAVQVDDKTRIEDGTAAEIVIGVRLEVEGRLENGILNAREIEFED